MGERTVRGRLGRGCRLEPRRGAGRERPHVAIPRETDHVHLADGSRARPFGDAPRAGVLRKNGTRTEARVGERPAYFGRFVPTAIYERARLPLGARLGGPAIVEQTDTTTVIPPGVTALVDPVGNLRLRRDR